MAAARAGSVSWAVIMSSVLSAGASTRTRPARPPGEASRLSSSMRLCMMGRVVAIAA